MKPELAATRLAELGNVTRLAIFRLLVRAGHDGMSISEVRDRLDIPMSTLVFHLRGLVHAGLVEQEKSGRIVTCRAGYGALEELIGFLKDQCCQGLPAMSAEKRKRDVA
ncbi:MAG TPA: helix-turn-helix domain-containing protein [Vineibacter sp.]|nr:helix-turn-helix domain-containing protein [Vineibacter sp.]